jgi:hypothetical protein
MPIGIGKHQVSATRCWEIWSSALLSYGIPLAVPNVCPKNIQDTTVITLVHNQATFLGMSSCALGSQP